MLVASIYILEWQFLGFLISTLIAIVCIPPVASIVENKINFSMPGVLRFVLVFVLFIGLCVVSPHSSTTPAVNSEQVSAPPPNEHIESASIPAQTPVSTLTSIVTTSPTENTSAQQITTHSPQSGTIDKSSSVNNPLGKLRIGAFNVQVFGQSKASKPEVMYVLAKTIRSFDIIGIEEIRDESQTALLSLVPKVNEDGSKYAYSVSEKLGRTSSKEQYAYIYNRYRTYP